MTPTMVSAHKLKKSSAGKWSRYGRRAPNGDATSQTEPEPANTRSSYPSSMPCGGAVADHSAHMQPVEHTGLVVVDDRLLVLGGVDDVVVLAVEDVVFGAPDGRVPSVASSGSCFDAVVPHDDVVEDQRVEHGGQVDVAAGDDDGGDLGQA